MSDNYYYPPGFDASVLEGGLVEEAVEQVMDELREDSAAMAEAIDDADHRYPLFEDVEGVFLLPGYADMPGLVRLAERSGARIILLSGPSADSRDLSNAVTAYMVRSEDAVRAGDVPWTILRPSGFMSNTFQWVHQLSSADVVTLPFAGVPIAWIDPADIAAVAVLALTEPGHDRATYRLTGSSSIRPADPTGRKPPAYDRGSKVPAGPV